MNSQEKILFLERHFMINVNKLYNENQPEKSLILEHVIILFPNLYYQ